MCRYATHSYRTHFACLLCRHTAKYPRDVRPRCPRCLSPMIDMGFDFKPPRRADLHQWVKVRALAGVGIRFDSCGCTGPGPRPRTLGDAMSELGLRRKDRRR